MPIVSPRSCSVYCRKALTSEAVRSAQCELGDRSASTLSDEPEEQAPGVAVGPNGMGRSIPLLDHPLVKEGMQQPRERVDRFHGCTPSDACRQCDANVTEALVCLLQEILRDRDVDQRRMDIAVPEIGRQEWKLVLRIDAGAIPFENAIHDHGVTQVVNARTGLALRRLDPGTPQDVDEPPCDALTTCSVHFPDRARTNRNPGFAAPSPCRLASRYSRSADNALSVNGRISGFEELRLPDGNRARSADRHRQGSGVQVLPYAIPRNRPRPAWCRS